MHARKFLGLRKLQQTFVAIMVLAALLLPAIPAKAVYNGAVDTGNEFSNVGIVFPENTNKKWSPTFGGPPEVIEGTFCAGVLIAPTLVLTTGNDCLTFDDSNHVKYGYFSPVVDFDPLYDWGDVDENGDPLPFFGEGTDEELGPYSGGPICETPTQPCYRGKLIKMPGSDNNHHDLAMLRLEQPVAGIDPATLPAFKSLNGFEGDVTSVGYSYVLCSGPDCPANNDEVTDAELIELNVIADRYILTTERRTAAMNAVLADWTPGANWFTGWLKRDKNTSKVMKLAPQASANNEYPCYDAGAGTFDADGVLVAMVYDYRCGPFSAAVRLDSAHARDFLCSATFRRDLKDSPLCGGNGAMQSASSGEATPDSSADRQQAQKTKHKAKSKQGGKQHGDGKRRR